MSVRGELMQVLWVGAGGFVGSSLRLSTDLPLVIEIVDTREKIEAFLPALDEALDEGLVTLEKVEIRFHRHSGQAKPRWT